MRILVPLLPAAVAALVGLVFFPFVAPADGAGASAGVAVSGTVLRPPAAVAKPAPPARYRTRRGAAPAEELMEADCGCDPGKYAVIHLTGPNLPPPRMPMAMPAMAQKDRRFEPAVLAVPVGAEVEFPNRDPFFHNVFSYSKPATFDLGRYPAGETAVVTFEKPGVIPVFCEIHYSMRAYVHVFDTPYFAVTDDARQFEIDDVLPGDYVVHVWQENLPEITMPLTVGAEPVALEIR